MRVRITPSTLSGNISIPSSKSMAHRAIICASLANGKSVVSNITYSKDIEATLSCMESLGAKIQKLETSCIIEGTDIFSQIGNRICDCNESGSTLRFLIPMASCIQGRVTFLGQGRLLERPMDVYEKIFKEQNLFFKQTKEQLEVKGPLSFQEYELRGDISSQFISGLLFILPLLKGDSKLSILPPFESKSYVDLTISMLKEFGIRILEIDETTYYVPGHQIYQAKDVCVEGDFSQMAFFACASCLNHEINCLNMNLDSLQGDKAILSILEKAGCTFKNENGITVSTIRPIGQTIDVSNCPDLGPILCVLAAYSKKETKIINAARLRMKESDRIEAMECELKKWNVDIQSEEDSITIQGKDSYFQKEVVHIHGHNDHRIVMAMTIFGLCANSISIIEDAQAISKSYPSFFDDIQRLGGKVEII